MRPLWSLAGGPQHLSEVEAGSRRQRAGTPLKPVLRLRLSSSPAPQPGLPCILRIPTLPPSVVCFWWFLFPPLEVSGSSPSPFQGQLFLASSCSSPFDGLVTPFHLLSLVSPLLRATQAWRNLSCIEKVQEALQFHQMAASDG